MNWTAVVGNNMNAVRTRAIAITRDLLLLFPFGCCGCYYRLYICCGGYR
jgi:hypothetical protein